MLVGTARAELQRMFEGMARLRSGCARLVEAQEEPVRVRPESPFVRGRRRPHPTDLPPWTLRGRSSVGRAPIWQTGGRGFESRRFHRARDVRLGARFRALRPHVRAVADATRNARRASLVFDASLPRHPSRALFECASTNGSPSGVFRRPPPLGEAQRSLPQRDAIQGLLGAGCVRRFRAGWERSCAARLSFAPRTTAPVFSVSSSAWRSARFGYGRPAVQLRPDGP